MEILCTLSFIATMSLLASIGYIILYLRKERRRRLEADEAHLKLLSEISEQFSSMLGALAVAGVVERAGNMAEGVSLARQANLGPDELADIDAIAAQLGLTREETLLRIAQKGLKAAVERTVAHERTNDAHCKGLQCTGERTCTCVCVGCRRAGRAS